MSGVLHVVATPIGNLGDMTARALQVLESVDRICAEDTRNSLKLLRHFGISTPLTALHDHNERDKLEEVLSWLGDGKSVALISDAGTPLINDPGYHLVSTARQRGFEVVAVPGACAAIAALSIAGLPTDRFVFEGFLPAKSAARKEYLRESTQQKMTQVYYESSHRIQACAKELQEIIGDEQSVVVARELTKLHEQVFCGSAAELVAWLALSPNHLKGEFVLMIAGAPEKANTDSELDELLSILLQEVSVKQSAGLAAKLTGASRNHCYKRAMLLNKELG